ncbi:MAG: 3-phosphoshikimate 1-carboxyvinyltransferase [Candidatus Micrarchaeota archaeon]|nr:3-phosphoshikimate 1-carboxyvinyltransferase [Candidatus Micrarchaeota archaeon]MDE1848210.1 3-phosphoshikimate 1-carboxyvinyltransferase [Candidatus Micrarchaeota archaeon]MDE1864858.1 3-phosphoshikimate 1-carboxyvinyltransferase [Candidatus Micrarchaeota archaeon]
MAILKVGKSELRGTVLPPPNKSITHRVFFNSTLVPGGESRVSNALLSMDTIATKNACEAFGAEFIEDGNSIRIIGPKSLVSKQGQINAENSGTTIRFSSAIAALLPSRTELSGDASLRRRPMQDELDALQRGGAVCTSTDGMPPVTVRGKFTKNKASINGNKSSQFVSALATIAPKIPGGLDILIKRGLVSGPYLDTTIGVQEEYGIRVETIKEHKEYMIPEQEYKPTDISVPIDYSGVALLLSCAILVGSGEMKIELPPDKIVQADKKIFDHLKELGVKVKNGTAASVEAPEYLEGGTFDLSETPDLIPPMAILGLKSKKPIEMVNIGHAKYKETDRIVVPANELRKLGLTTRYDQTSLSVGLGGKLKGAALDARGDHRLFMAFFEAAMYVGNCTVSGQESVGVSYPGYLRAMESLGAVFRN